MSSSQDAKSPAKDSKCSFGSRLHQPHSSDNTGHTPRSSSLQAACKQLHDQIGICKDTANWDRTNSNSDLPDIDADGETKPIQLGDYTKKTALLHTTSLHITFIEVTHGNHWKGVIRQRKTGGDTNFRYPLYNCLERRIHVQRTR